MWLRWIGCAELNELHVGQIHSLSNRHINWLLVAGMSSELIIPTLAERVLTHSSKRKRLTIASNGQPDELQLTRLHSFILNSINPSGPATATWPDQTQWAELALTSLFRESSSIWCKRSKVKSLQNALEKFCVAGSQARADYSAVEEAWWQRHRQHLINHVKPWEWCNGNQGYALGIREGIAKPLVPAKEIKVIVKRRRLEEYNAHKEDNEYTDGLKTCPRCLHRTIIINTSACLYGDCESQKKAGAAARKLSRTAAARPEACAVRCTGNGQMKGCGCVVFALPGETRPRPRQPGGDIESYQVNRCHLHKYCDIRHAEVREGLCDVCTATLRGARRCKRCQCIDYEHSLRKCDDCVKLITSSQSDQNVDAPGEYIEQCAGPEFFDASEQSLQTYCRICTHFKKQPENKITTKGRSSRLRNERENGLWPGLVKLRKSMPKYVDLVESEFQKHYDAEGPETNTALKLLMARLGIYVSGEMMSRVYYLWKKRRGYVK